MKTGEMLILILNKLTEFERKNSTDHSQFDKKFDEIDNKLASHDQNFEQIDTRFEGLEKVIELVLIKIHDIDKTLINIQALLNKSIERLDHQEYILEGQTDRLEVHDKKLGIAIIEDK